MSAFRRNCSDWAAVASLRSSSISSCTMFILVLSIISTRRLGVIDCAPTIGLASCHVAYFCISVWMHIHNCSLSETVSPYAAATALEKCVRLSVIIRIEWGWKVENAISARDWKRQCSKRFVIIFRCATQSFCEFAHKWVERGGIVHKIHYCTFLKIILDRKSERII